MPVRGRLLQTQISYGTTIGGSPLDSAVEFTFPDKQKFDFYTEGNLRINDAATDLAVKAVGHRVTSGRSVVLVTGCGAANGATMVAVNLAVSLAQSGYTTLLVDADMRTRSKHRNRAGAGLYDYLRGAAGFEDVVGETGIQFLSYAPGGNGVENPALLLCSGRMGIFLARAKKAYDFVILDCPPVTVLPDAGAMFADADGIALVCALHRTTRRQLAMAKAAAAPYGDKYYGLVVNDAEPRQYRKLFPERDYYRKKKPDK